MVAWPSYKWSNTKGERNQFLTLHLFDSLKNLVKTLNDMTLIIRAFVSRQLFMQTSLW